MARVRNAYRFCQNSNPWLYYAIGLTTFMSVMVMVMQTHDREIPDWVNTTYVNPTLRSCWYLANLTSSVGGVWGCATALILFFNAFRKIRSANLTSITNFYTD
jgi:hypothetical protein